MRKLGIFLILILISIQIIPTKAETSDEWYKKGVEICKSNGSLQEELNCYLKAIELDSGNHAAWYAAGACYLQMEKLQDAKQCCSKAYMLAPNVGYMWYKSYDDTSKTVYMTATGKCYHSGNMEGCTKESCIPISQEDALDLGLKPCGRDNCKAYLPILDD